MSYSATSPLLSDVGNFPLFYRTVPSYAEYGNTIYALMQHFDWLLVGAVHQDSSHYTSALEDLSELLTQKSNQTANVITSFSLNSFLTRSDSSATIIASITRIFIAMVPESLAAETICAAHKSGRTGRNFLWILLGDYRQDWWVPDNRSIVVDPVSRTNREQVTCTTDEMRDGVESVLILSHHLLMLEENPKLSAKEREFWQEYIELVNASTGSVFREELATSVKPTYDAVWAVAYALRSALSQAPNDSSTPSQATPTRFDGRISTGPSFSEGRPVTDFTSVLNARMEKTNFEGLSGTVKFDSTSHSRGQPLTYILQMQGGKMVPIGIHSQGISGGSVLNLTFFDNNGLSFHGRPTPPRDRPVLDLQSVELWMVCIMITVAMVGVIFAASVLVVNCMYRKHKVIKASSPYLNFVIALGCIMGFLSVIFMSTETLKAYFSVKFSFSLFFCNIRLWLLTIGFTLAFGALFAKTWRIYVIFRNPWKKKRPYKDRILFCMVAVFLLFDLIILFLWAIADPLDLKTASELDRSAFTVQKYAYCVNSRLSPDDNLSFVAWTSIVVIPKSLLLFFGVFLVVQTSRIKAKFFRDARFTGIAIFGCVMVCGVGVPVSFFTMFLYHEDLGYFVATSTILICCYLVLLMVFVPKFVLLHRYKNKVPSAVLIGLNPSFRIQRARRLEKMCSYRKRGEQPMTYYARMLRGTTGSVYSRASQSSSNSSDESSSCADLQAKFTRENELVDLASGIGWEAAFDDDLDGKIEVQEARLDFGGFECITTVNVLRRPSRVSTDTQMTVISEMEDFGGELGTAGPGCVVAGREFGGGTRKASHNGTEQVLAGGGNIGDDGIGTLPRETQGGQNHHRTEQNLRSIGPRSNSGSWSSPAGSISGAVVRTNRYETKAARARSFIHPTRSCTTILEREELENASSPLSPLSESFGHTSSSHDTLQGAEDDGTFCVRTRSRSLTVTPSPTPH